MSIFLLLRVYASSFFHRFGWAGLAIALGIHLSTAWLGLVRTHSDDLTLATHIEGGELFYIASTRLKEISNGMV